MTLEGFRTFCAVVEEGTFRGAAVRLHRSQPAVSQQIKSLEEATGHRLVDRRGCRPTPVGERLYERARVILTEADGLERELADLVEGESRELRVGTSDTTALYVLPPVVGAFSRAMPRTRLVITNRSSEAVAGQVLRGDAELGIVTLPVGHEDLEEHALFDQRLVLVAPKGHGLAGRKRVPLDRLRDEPLLLLDAQTRTGAVLRDFFRREDFRPSVALDSGSFEVIKRYVREGVGLAFLPEIVVEPGDRALVTASVPGLPSVEIGAVWRRHAYRSKGARVFLDLIAQERSVGSTGGRGRRTGS